MNSFISFCLLNEAIRKHQLLSLLFLGTCCAVHFTQASFNPSQPRELGAADWFPGPLVPSSARLHPALPQWQCGGLSWVWVSGRSPPPLGPALADVATLTPLRMGAPMTPTS